MEIPPLLTLEEAAERPAEQIGGKARVLGKLRKAGFPVPEGFVIPDGADMKDVLPLLNQATALHPGALWAVRSSSASEDTAQASFAGQYQSFLNIEAKEIPAHILKCREAGNSDAVNAYRALSNDSAVAKTKLAVIIQLMVKAETAGIAFTADPVTGKRDHIWIEMVKGYGDAAASGSTEPALVCLRRNDLVELPGRATSLLSGKDITALGKMMLAVEKSLGEPQDIEWAIESGRLMLLQARPVTTGDYGWTRANVGEIFPEPVTPMTWSLLQRFLSGENGTTTPLAKLIGGKVHLRHDLARLSFEWLLIINTPTLEHALGMEKWGEIPSQRYLNWRNWVATLIFLADYVGIVHRLENKVQHFITGPRPAVPRDKCTLDELAALTLAWENWTRKAFSLHLYATTYAIGASRLARIGKKGSMPATRSSRIGRMLWNLAIQARRYGLESILAQEPADGLVNLRERLEHQPGGKDWLDQFDYFLSEYGCRCANEFELTSPRWHETPEIPLGMVRTFLISDNRFAPEQFNGAHQKEGSRSNDGFGRMSAAREEMKHVVVTGYSALRGLFLRIGEQLTMLGRISSPEGIFFLSYEELQQLLQGQGEFEEQITLRKARWESWRRQDQLPVGQENIQAGQRLHGISVSRGVVSGVARVLHDLSSSTGVQPGDILVLPNADPAWTPLFIKAAAVVCDVGGLMSHSATVAREFSVPAVFNTGDATQRIRDGQVIIVNGNEGWVQ
jgi:pyruvate,water dikinase